MNLHLQLLLRILLIALLSLLMSAAYLLHQTNQQSILQAETTAKRINGQMTAEQLRNFSRYDYRTPFPSTGLWSDISGLPGSCIQFLSRTESRRRSMCSDINEAERSWPHWFGALYQQFFQPDYEASRRFSFNAITYGTILVTLNRQTETARAWHNLQAVIGILTFSILAVCLLVYFTINRLLRPAQQIIRGLETMRNGDLNSRIPDSDISEWRRTGEAINALVIQQQRVIDDNRQLSLKLMNLQEEEHRYIARELHDEFGQCLAGINAITASIRQSARAEYPQILPETENIAHITEHMMVALRNLLTRLRPIEVDEIGLEASLQKLVKSWRQRSGQQTDLTLQIETPLDDLTEPLPVNIYRIVQESLTNIAKHAQARNAHIIISGPQTGRLQLIIEDDGLADDSSLKQNIGIGLLGIQERSLALGGQCLITVKPQGGLSIMINLPFVSSDIGSAS